MDPPGDDIDHKPEKLDEEKESGPLFHCEFFDMDIVHKIGQALLPGLASACIDNTIGGLFKTPASVAVELRREMVDYLILRSESFVVESVILEGGTDVDVSVDPYDIIPDFVDDFVSSKRNFFSRVSGWLLSEKREDWIDDLVQEMEINGFWLSGRRDSVAQTLLKNLDFKNTYHCSMSFRNEEDLERHKLSCGFRTMSCENEGCDSSFSAAQMDHHDSTCPFKILPCEQNCVDSIMRREMDRHCITICPMKLVKCPFHAVGCQSTVPQSMVEGHRAESLDNHLIFILKGFHKEASRGDLEERAKEIEKLSSREQLASTRDARSLTNLIKRLEARLGPLKVKQKEEEDNNNSNTDSIDDKKEETGTKHVRFENLPSKKEEEVAAAASISVQEENPKDTVSPTRAGEMIGKSPKEENLKESPYEDHEKEEKTVNSHSNVNDHNDSSHEKRELVDSSTNNVSIQSVQEENPKDITKDNEQTGELSKEEKLIESPEQAGSPVKADEQMGKLSKEENLKESCEDNENKETVNSHSKASDHNDSDDKKTELVESPKDLGSPAEDGEQMGKLPKEESFEESPEHAGLPVKADEQMGKLSKEENLKESREDNENGETANSHSKASDHNDSDDKKTELVESPKDLGSLAEDGEQMGKLPKEESFEESPEHAGSPVKADEQMGKLSKEENLKESHEDNENGETVNSHSKVSDHNDSEDKKTELVESPKYLGSPAEDDEQMGKLPKEASFEESPFQKNEDLGSPKKVDVHVVDPIEEEHYVKPTIKHEEMNESVDEGSTARNEALTKSIDGE